MERRHSRAALSVLAVCALTSVGCGKKEPPAFSHPTHGLDLELTGQDYSVLLRSLPETTRTRASLQDILSAGERNLKWLNAINAQLPQILILWPPGSSAGIPIESPSKYSPTLIREKYSTTLSTMPADMKAVILGQTPLPTALPADLAEYIKWARAIDRSYQTAARWTMMEPNLASLQGRKYQDVRGYYFLSKETDIESTLRDFANLPVPKQTELRPWLVNACENARVGTSTCQGRLKTAENLKDVWGFYSTYRPKAKAMWDSFFKIQAPRRDALWQGNVPGIGTVLSVPFRDPRKDDVQDFLTRNIEDEWRVPDFQLKLQFTSTAATYIEFQPNVTPHVNKVGGNIITMNSLDSLDQWETQWTIRHEYGHTLGFIDCYIEFWDATEGVMVNYQLDVTNLMCSRAGHLQAKHVDELRAAHGP